MTVLDSIRQLLQQQQVTFRELHHEPTFTSEEAASVRGEELHNGGKALLMKVEGEFCLFVLPADRKIRSAHVRQYLGKRKMRFASREELAELTAGEDFAGLVPGSVPPFGQPILPFPLYVDSGIQQNQRIAFNAGSLQDSIIMPVEDYLSVAEPTAIFEFSCAEE